MKKRSVFSEIYIALVLLLMYLPILVVVICSFNDTKLFHRAGFTFAWNENLFHNAQIISAFWTSLELALTSSLLAALLGTLGAVGLAGKYFRGR